jgi:hypothetical protein
MRKIAFLEVIGDRDPSKLGEEGEEEMKDIMILLYLSVVSSEFLRKILPKRFLPPRAAEKRRERVWIRFWTTS